ncbi:MAG: GNAT family N-acetyltransferase [Ruminococcaceae bacterium]|jgi:GNAT superfamily N-acetyltransferase|nr:GNAT family N-acetyltransferase [Oscillospiraceae bacterium]
MELEYKTLFISKSEIEQPERRALLDELMALSREWADEGCCPSYGANDAEEFLDKPVYAAFSDGIIVAYAMGHEETLERDHSYGKTGETAFELDELFVTRSFRKQGVGRVLCEYLEEELSDKVALIELIAATNRYEELLRFYTRELGMTFNYAFLVKRIAAK